MWIVGECVCVCEWMFVSVCMDVDCRCVCESVCVRESVCVYVYVDAGGCVWCVSGVRFDSISSNIHMYVFACLSVLLGSCTE